MKHIINNFKMGLIVAIVFTCLQSYGLYKYGAGLTYAYQLNIHSCLELCFCRMVVYRHYIYICCSCCLSANYLYKEIISIGYIYINYQINLN